MKNLGQRFVLFEGRGVWYKHSILAPNEHNFFYLNVYSNGQVMLSSLRRS